MDTIERFVDSVPPDRTHHVAELWTRERQFAEINQEHEKLQIEIGAKPNGEPWIFDYDDLLAALQRGKVQLVGEENSET